VYTFFSTSNTGDTMNKHSRERNWLSVPGTLDYVSADGTLYAMYHDSYRGVNYWTFDAKLPESQRKMRNALYLGGLPMVRPFASLPNP
jgi:hypothetical protein